MQNDDVPKERLLLITVTFFFIFFPLSAVVGGLIFWMLKIACPIWAIILIGILAFLIAAAIWLVIIGHILRSSDLEEK